MINKKVSGFKYFFLGLLAFLTLGMDLFIMPIDKLIYGDIFQMETFFESPWYVLVTHWSFVIAAWIIGFILLFSYLKKKDELQDVVSFDKGFNITKIFVLALTLSLIFTFIESKLFNESLPQFYYEYTKFYKVHGSMALIVSIFQNIYYVVESILVVLLLALMQRAGESWFNNKYIPFGGVGLLLTWGISHLTKGLATGMWISGLSLVLGYLFIRADKRWWPSILFVWLLFFI